MNKSVFQADDDPGLLFQVCMGANLTCMNDLMNRMGQFDHVDYNGIQVRMRVVLDGDKLYCLEFKTSLIFYR